jgi:hypothetical protein
MAAVQGAEIIELIVDSGEWAKDLKRPGMDRLLVLVDEREVDTVIIAKLDRLTRSVKDLAELLERFQRRGVSLVSVAESLDTGSAAGEHVEPEPTEQAAWRKSSPCAARGARCDRSPSHLTGRRCAPGAARAGGTTTCSASSAAIQFPDSSKAFPDIRPVLKSDGTQ